MSKKNVEPEETNFADEVPENGDDTGSMTDVDFNINDEYKPDPLIPKGTYHGAATGVKFVGAQHCIVWDFCLHDNGGFMSDGQTPIDGAHVFFRNWLPKPGDETEMTKSGRNTKRQSKINMLADFQKSLGIDMSTPGKIAEALSNQEWIGVEASLDIDVDEYEGRVRNVVNKVAKSRMF